MTRTALVALFLGAGAGFVGCRCNESDGGRATAADGGQPAMPTGMLAPIPSATLAPGEVGDAGALPREDKGPARLRMTTGEKGGAFTELQVAKKDDPPTKVEFEHWQASSRFLSLDAMTLLGEPFAKAKPGFNVFLPQLFAPAALERLAAELATFEQEWSAVTTVTAAKAKWGKLSSYVEALGSDADWIASRDELAKTMRALGALATAHAKKSESLWVLGP